MAWTVPITIDGTTFPVDFEGDAEPTQAEINEAVSILLDQSPQDTGQGYVSSLVNSAGRGFARVAADIPGGLGYLTGSDTLVQMGDSIEAGINEALPVNPIYANDFAMKAAGAVGQAGSMFATAGIGGTIGKGFGAVRLGAEAAGLGSGFLAGARGGGQEAERYGLEGTAAYGRVLAGGTIELATEKLLFGMGTETRTVRSMLGDTVESGWGRFIKDVATEGGEEGIAEISNNAATALLAPSGTQTPGLLDGSLEASLLGMVGGSVFGGVNALAGRGQAEAPVTVESGTIPFSAAPGAQALVPGPTARTEIAGQPFYFDGLQWNKLTDPSQVSASPELEPPFIPLNPTNPIEGTLIVELENRRKAAMRQGQIQTPEETSATSSAPPRGTLAPVETSQQPTFGVDISADNPPPTVAKDPVRPERKSRALNALPDPTDADIISALQGENMRLGQVNEGGEWDWYRDLEKAASTSKLKKQEIAARVRRGELEDPAALLEWVNQNVVDRASGMKIDEAASLLQNMDGYQSFDVDANSIGAAVMEALSQREKSRQQGGWDDHMAREEADQVAKERQQTREFLAHAYSSSAPSVSGNQLSQQVEVGSTVNIHGVVFTVAEVNPSNGTLGLNDESGRFGYQSIQAEDILPIEKVDGAVVAAREDDSEYGGEIAFAKDDADKQLRLLFDDEADPDEAAADAAMDAKVDREDDILNTYSEDDLSTWPLPQAMRDRAQAALDVLEEAGYDLEQLAAAVADQKLDQAAQQAARDLLELRKRADARWGVAHAFMKSRSARYILGIDKAVSENQNADDEPADSTFNSFRFTPVEDGALAEREREVLDRVRRSEGNPAISAVKIALPDRGREQGTAPTEFLGAVREVFGKDVLFLDPGHIKPISFEGASIQGQRNTIVLDASSKSPVLYLTGHELVHALKEQRRELWNKLRDELLAMASDWSDYRDRLGKRYQDDQIVDEFLGDVVGGQFRERAFWEKLEQRNPSLFRRLASAALQFLNRILGKVGGLSRDVRGYFADIEAARDVIADVLEQYAAARHFPDRTLIEGDDADLARAARVDKPRRGPNLLRANLPPQQPGSAHALDTFRAALESSKPEIERLGAQVEEIDSEEARRRGLPPSFTIGASQDGRRLTLVTDKLATIVLAEDGVRAVVREEVIHLAWLAAMRAEYQRSGGYYPFDQWMESELSGWIHELLSSPQGSQVLLDAANTYDQPSLPYQTAEEALTAYEGRESLLVPELARQLIQLRESGQTTESAIARVMNKIRKWFTAALERLRAVAADVGQVSPSLDAAIKETERILAGASAVPPGDASGLPPLAANLDPMRLTSLRMSEASQALREMLKPHKATRDERTVDGNPIEQAGYLVRRDADMEAAADNWLDAFAENEAMRGHSQAEVRARLNETLDEMDVDVAAVLLTRLMDERAREFGYDSSEVQALGQKNASRAGFALREWKKTLDPLDKLVDQATAKTGATMGKELGLDTPQEGDPAEVPAQLNQQLQRELQAEANQAALDAIESLRSANSDLRKSLQEARERAEEERARADQEREVGIAIGHEEGLAQGRAEQPPAPPREIDLFENWLMGEVMEGLPSLETFARRFLQPQRWDGERFRWGLAQLFPALDPNILDDAVDRITERMNNRLAAARRRAISAFMDRLAERNSRLKNDQRFVSFYGHLQKAAEYGILDSQVFADSFASAWSLNGLTPATVMQLRQMYQQITATNANGQPMYFGMVRETMERRFIEAVNRIAPGQAWLNFVFNNYQARVLSSASSILNQFSSVFRILAPVDAISRSFRMGQVTHPSTVLSEYWAGLSSLGRNLPLMLTALRGESLGHLPSQVASGHVPTEQQTQHLQPGEAVRVGNTRLSPRLSWLTRMAELWSWRTIRAAEGLTGVADAEAHFRETLTNHYRAQGMTPLAARQQALQEIHASASEVTAARQQALQEQSSGSIGAGSTVIERRVAEIIQRNIENRLGASLVARTEQLTGYAQFKTLPTGPIGFAVSKMMASLASPASKTGQVARFWFLFGRFLGHTVDVTLGYTPGAHLLTRSTGEAGSQRNQLIREVFGSEEAYRQMVDSRAVTGSTFFLMTGALMALALSMADDDDEPFFAVTGSGGIGDPSRKDALKATGQWGEMQIRIGGRPVISYGQIPELSPLLSILGNISDNMRFGHFLNQRQARDGEQPGKYPADLSTLGLGFGFDWALSPIKRSTYRAWFDALDGMMSIQSAGSADYAGQQFLGLVTRPVDGMLRVPMVVDVDKALRFAEGSLKPDGMLEGLLRRVPFAHVGTEVYNAYGERTPAWDIFSMFPSSPNFSKEAERAARLNVETGTRRSAPKDISLHYTDGSVRELKPEELQQYQRLSGQLYTESLLRNETDIRRAYQQGGQGAASKIVDNISAKANQEARKQLRY